MYGASACFVLFTEICIFHTACGSLDVTISPSEIIVPPDYTDPIVLRCGVDIDDSLRNSSETSIHWTKDGLPIIGKFHSNNVSAILTPQDEESAFVLDDDSLFIGRLTRAEEGMYACTVRLWESGEITAEERAVVPVYFAKLEDFSFVSSDTEREEGTFATLTCVSGFSIPPANVTWTKADGHSTGGIQSQHILRQDQGMYMTSSSIQFSNLSREDHGEYSCVAVNEILPFEVKFSNRVFLRVKEKPTPPGIVLQPENVYVMRGQPSKFLCISSGSPIPTITWYKDYVNIDTKHPDGEGTELEAYGHASVLTIPSTFERFTGQYWCLAENQFGRAMSESAELQIASFSWRFVQEPEDTEVSIGESVTMICRPPLSQPPAIVSWYKDDDKLDFADRSSAWQLPTGDLYISKVTLTDAGKYFCNAHNELLQSTTASQRARLTVYAPPAVSKLPDSVDVVLEKTVKLECNTTGYPFPYVEWTKNGIPLASGGRITLGLRNQTLFITDAATGDEALYGCIAKNKFGNDSAGPCLLNVIVPPIIHKKVPINSLIDLDVSFVIPCIASGTPEPNYNWTKNDLLLNITGGSRYSLVEKGLQIESVQELDSARYNCTAYNSAGVAWSEGIISVKVPATITEISNEAVVKEHKNINLTCRGRGYPEVAFEWTFQPGDDSITIEHTTTYLEGGAMLTMKNVSRAAHGRTVICQALNFWSSDNASLTLEVLTTPEVMGIAISEKSPITPGTNVTITCSIQGRPTPSVKWMHRHSSDSLSVTLKENDGHFETFDHGRLNIASVQENDEGTFTCVAENSVGQSSAQVSIIILDLPEIVNDVQLITLSSNSIKVMWSSEDFERNIIKSYSLRFRKETQFGNYTNVHQIANEGLNYVVLSRLKPAIKYIVQISAENDAGSSLWSVDNVVATFAAAPSMPVEISVDLVTSSSFDASWKRPENPNGEIVEYEVRYKKISPGKYYPLVKVRLPAGQGVKQNYTMSNLDPFCTYIVEVKAGTIGENDTVLWGETSPFLSVDTAEAAPSIAPLNVKVKVISSNSIFASWSEIPDDKRNGIVIEYRIKYEDTLVNTSKEISINSTELSYLNTNFSPWREYAVRLSGATSAGNGPWTRVFRVRTLPSAPNISISGLSLHSISSQWVRLTWNPLSKREHNGPGMYYTISISKIGNESEKQELTTTTNSSMITGLMPWTYYRAKVRAQNEVKGYGPWSTDLMFRTNDSAPGTCSDLRTLSIDWDSILLQWRPPKEPNGVLTGYVVRYNTLSCALGAFVIDIEKERCVLHQQDTSTLGLERNQTTALLDLDHKQKNAILMESVREARRTENSVSKIQDVTTSSDTLGNTLSGPISTSLPRTSSGMTLMLDIIEGPIVEQFVSVIESIDDVVNYRMASLLEYTVYKISVEASNSAGRGLPVVLHERTVMAPTTTPHPTTAAETTTMEEATSIHTQGGTSAAPRRSALIAGGTAGAVFICIVVAMVAASKWISGRSSRQKRKDFVVLDSPVTPKRFSKTSSAGNLMSLQESRPIAREPPAMASFTGPTEEWRGQRTLGSNNKYAVTHYRRCHSPGSYQSDSEFEYAVIQDGIKAFGDSRNKSANELETDVVYVQSDDIPTKRGSYRRSAPKRRAGLEVENATNPKHVDDDANAAHNWTLRSYASESSSARSKALKDARKKSKQKSTRSVSRMTYSDIDDIDPDGDLRAVSGGSYPYGQYNTNNNRSHFLPGETGNHTNQVSTHYIEEDTYL